jgi:hypothetical protein
MPTFTPAPFIPSGSFNGASSPAPVAFTGHPGVGFVGTYGELGITYGESSHLFNGIHGAWRYGGFFGAFTGHDPDATGMFTTAPGIPSGAFDPS